MAMTERRIIRTAQLLLDRLDEAYDLHKQLVAEGVLERSALMHNHRKAIYQRLRNEGIL